MSSISIECVCIDDSNKPNDIPLKSWVKKGEIYHVTHIYNKVVQGISAVELKEFDLTKYGPYDSFSLGRFAFKESDLPKLKELTKRCSELNSLKDLNLNKLIE